MDKNSYLIQINFHNQITIRQIKLNCQCIVCRNFDNELVRGKRAALTLWHIVNGSNVGYSQGSTHTFYECQDTWDGRTMPWLIVPGLLWRPLQKCNWTPLTDRGLSAVVVRTRNKHNGTARLDPYGVWNCRLTQCEGLIVWGRIWYSTHPVDISIYFAINKAIEPNPFAVPQSLQFAFTIHNISPLMGATPQVH